MKKNAQLAAYMNCIAPEGLDLDGYVEHSACLLSPAEIAGLGQDLPGLRTKIATLEAGQPRLSRQLAFLLRFYEADPPNLPDKVRRETIFALLYAAKEEDLVPDSDPEAGYLDDAAITESVLSRHGDFFAPHCRYHGMDWAALQPAHRG